MAGPPSTPRRSGDSGRNATADRAMDLLRLFHDERPTLSAVEVARELGTSRSTTYRYLHSLRSQRFLEEDERGGFRLGPVIFELARVARIGLGLSEVALPVVRRLVAELDQTVLLTRRFGNQVVTIEREEPRSRIRLSYERGQALPLHAGASARVLLAFAGDEDLDTLLGPGRLQRFTDRTITDRKALRRELAATRDQGYALSRGEVDEGVVGVAAPVVGEDERVVAALSAVDTEFRVSDKKLDRMVAAVLRGAEEIGERLRLVQL